MATRGAFVAACLFLLVLVPVLASAKEVDVKKVTKFDNGTVLTQWFNNATNQLINTTYLYLDGSIEFSTADGRHFKQTFSNRTVITKDRGLVYVYDKIDWNNGSYITSVINAKTGKYVYGVFKFPNGTVEYEYPNGTREVELRQVSKKEVHKFIVLPDGATEDMWLNATNYAPINTTQINPDGTNITRNYIRRVTVFGYPNGTTVKVKKGLTAWIRFINWDNGTTYQIFHHRKTNALMYSILSFDNGTRVMILPNGTSEVLDIWNKTKGPVVARIFMYPNGTEVITWVNSERGIILNQTTIYTNGVNVSQTANGKIYKESFENGTVIKIYRGRRFRFVTVDWGNGTWVQSVRNKTDMTFQYAVLHFGNGSEQIFFNNGSSAVYKSAPRVTAVGSMAAGVLLWTLLAGLALLLL